MNKTNYDSIDHNIIKANFSEYGFYIGSSKIDIADAYMFERSYEALIAHVFAATFDAGVRVSASDKDGNAMTYPCELKGAEFKGVGDDGELVNIEDWIIENAVTKDGVKGFIEW